MAAESIVGCKEYTVNGDGGLAVARNGDNNTATANTDGCTAQALGGNQTDSC